MATPSGSDVAVGLELITSKALREAYAEGAQAFGPVSPPWLQGSFYAAPPFAREKNRTATQNSFVQYLT